METKQPSKRNRPAPKMTGAIMEQLWQEAVTMAGLAGYHRRQYRENVRAKDKQKHKTDEEIVC